MKKFIVLIIGLMLFAGCDTLRFGATQSQKQNAWLHQKTAQLAADTATQQQTSRQLQSLTQLSELQSRAFVADYGQPAELPASDTIDGIFASQSIAQQALTDSSQKPDTWDVIDGAMDVGIGIAGLMGGVWGVRVASFLTRTQKQSLALREVVLGNELFKTQNANAAADFKNSHLNQSSTTKQIVSEIKNS